MRRCDFYNGSRRILIDGYYLADWIGDEFGYLVRYGRIGR